MRKTNFFELPLYDENDSGNFMDQYNQAIIRIDQILHQFDVQNQIRNGN